MAKFKIVTQQAAGTSFGVSGGGYKLEMEGLGACDAEIVEVPIDPDEFPTPVQAVKKNPLPERERERAAAYSL